MYPDNIKPLRVCLYVHRLEAPGLVGNVAVVGETVHELLVAVTGVVSVQPEVGPLHEDVGHKLEWLQ